MKDQLKWVLNHMPKSDDQHLDVMSLPNVAKARSFHGSFPQYSITPLAQLDGMAQYLGLALLSGLTDDEVRQLYAGYRFFPYTPNSIMDLDTLIAALQDIRSAGIAYESEESTAEICCVAVPLAENGQVKAAISVTTPKFRYTDEKKQQITQLLLKKRQLIEESCRIQNCRLVF